MVAVGRNPAAALLCDGKVIAAVEEERFLRIKHARHMPPIRAIEWCLEKAKITAKDIDLIGVQWDGPHSFDEVKHFVHHNIESRKFWHQAILNELFLKDYLSKRFPNAKIFPVRHHLAHAASVCYVSGWEKSLFITLDNRGETESGILGIFERGDFSIIRRMSIYESLGRMYELFTEKIGFEKHSAEGKTMGLAPYGTIIPSMTDIAKMDKYGKLMIDTERIHSIPLTHGMDPTKDKRKDVAATAQYLLEKCVLALLEKLVEVDSTTRLCFAGGIALNIDLNGMILESGLVKQLFVQPGASDAGTALGAALYLHHQFSNSKIEKMDHVYFGPEYTDEHIKKCLDFKKIKYYTSSDITSETAALIANNKIVGWFQGRAEFGPRALGNRSILANPVNKKMWYEVNKVKRREYWRPLAPSVLEEHSRDYFSNSEKSPFMLLKFQVKEEKINQIPAVVHIDGSARPQTVSKHTNELYYNLIKKFEQDQGVPLLLNTSLNLRGEPLANNPNDAILNFLNSNMDVLCIGKYIAHKE